MRGTIPKSLLLVALAACSCEGPSTSSVSPTRVHVSIVDHASRGHQDVVILSLDVPDKDKALVADLCRYAAGHFPDRSWVNYAPDSSYREIILSDERGGFQLRSWHPLYETDPSIDDPEYVARRKAFDHIEQQLRRAFAP